MHSKKQDCKNTSRLTHGLLAAAVAALVAMPVAFASGADGPVATKSAASLTKQVKSLKKRVAALESRQTPQIAAGGGGVTQTTPTGPAGGDLTGTYPNPTIGVDKVTSAKVANDSLTGLDIADNLLTEADLSPGSVGFNELQVGVVGNDALRDVIAVVGTGVGVAAGSSNTASVVCPGASMLIAGGYAWQNDQAGTSIIASAPSETIPNSKWIVTGRATTANTLFPWATCIGV